MGKTYSVSSWSSLSSHKAICRLWNLSYQMGRGEDFGQRNMAVLESALGNFAGTGHLQGQALYKEFCKFASSKELRQWELYMTLLERFKGESPRGIIYSHERDYASIRHMARREITVIIDQVRSAHNVGSILRACECFGAKQCWALWPSPTPQLAQVQKTAMGAEKMVPWKAFRTWQEVMAQIRKEKLPLVALEACEGAQELGQMQWPERFALVAGHEQWGVQQKILQMAQATVSIAMFGQKNSLNVAQALSIVLHHAQGQ